MHHDRTRRIPRPVRRVVLLLLTCVSLVTSGCVSSILANKIIRAPNLQASPQAIKDATALQLSLANSFYSLATKIKVGPDPAELSVAVLEPGDYKFRH